MLRPLRPARVFRLPTVCRGHASLRLLVALSVAGLLRPAGLPGLPGLLVFSALSGFLCSGLLSLLRRVFLLRTEGQLFHRENFRHLRISLLKEYANPLAQNIQFDHLSCLSIRRNRLLTHLRHSGVQELIGGLFIFQAAHQPAAGSRNLRRIQRQVLFLRHLDRYRLEVPKKCSAAQLSPADPNASQHPCLIPHADLAQFDPHMKDTGKVLDQASEIHPSVRRKIKQHLGPVKRVLGIHHLHVELMLAHLFPADAKRLLLPDPERVDLLLILDCRLAHNRAQRLLDEFLIHHLHAGGNDPVILSF